MLGQEATVRRSLDLDLDRVAAEVDRLADQHALRVLELLRLSPLAAWHYSTMWRDSYVEVDKAKRLLGWQPKYSNAEALIRAWDWYIENRGRYDTGVTHRVAWQKGALAILRRIS